MEILIIILALCGGVLSLAIYFLPGVVAFMRGHQNTLAIFSPAHLKGVWDVDTRVDANDITVVQQISTANASSVIFSVERHRGYYGDLPGATAKKSLIKNWFEYQATGPWSEECVGGLIYINEDSRAKTPLNVIRRINSVSTTILENDTLNWKEALSAALSNDCKFSVVYSEPFDKRGVWVTNGRKFWLFRSGAFVQYLDMGSDDYIGKRWDVARISRNLVMFVNDSTPARVVRLDSPSTDATANDLSLAGTVTPQKDEQDESGARSWAMEAKADANNDNGALSAGVYKIRIRAVNLDDGGESKFVDIYNVANTAASLTVIANDAISVFTPTYGTGLNATETTAFHGFGPPTHRRWTHIEFWRTNAAGATYYLETRIPIQKYLNENIAATNAILNSGQIERTLEIGSLNYPVGLADSSATALTALTTADLLAGGLPPICRKIASLAGVTICAGRAGLTPESASVDAVQYFAPVSAATYTTVTRTFSRGGAPNVTYTWKDGDKIEVTDGGDGGLALGLFELDSTSGTNTFIVVSDDVPGTVNSTDVRFFVRRPVTIKYPTIESDEDIWYSRTELFSPESFPTRTLQLSAIGDTLRDLVNVGAYVAVIMQRGVHLLFLDGTTLVRDTIAPDAEGTPWEDSVVTIGQAVLWATPTGPNIMVVSNGVNQNGHRGEIKPFDPQERMRNWFAEAAEKGYSIDAGVDTFNKCIRWRRKQDANTYQVAQVNYGTGQWTLLDDDNGVRYVRSALVEETPASAPYLYSFTAEGAALRVNYQGTTDPYSDATVQDVTDESYVVAPTSIRLNGVFSAKMIGDVVRFRSTNSNVDGKARVIREATEDKIVFDFLSGLTYEDEFIIGANRFRVKFAPKYGTQPMTVKTLDAFHGRALPGQRNGTAGPWPNPPDKSITVRAYRNFSTTADATATMPIYDETSASRVSLDRTLDLAAQGTAIEFEVECIESRTDFGIELLSAEVREEATYVEDVSAK